MQKAQLLKGILEGCVLAIISRGETYGYQILFELNQNGFEDLIEGTLYPLLTRLEKNGLISCRVQKSPFGPSRKYFSITPEGERSLAEFVVAFRQMTVSVDRLLPDQRKENTDV